MACASCDACLRATGTCHEAQVRCERENPKDDTEHRASFRWSIQKESHGLPNESRLSCGAELEGSQGEFYHTARQTFSGSIGDGRRQLQAHVRLRATSHSSGPSSPGAQRGTRHHLPHARIVTPNGPTLRTPQRRRGPRATGPSLGKALRIEPNHPDRCRLQRGADHVGVHKRIGLW